MPYVDEQSAGNARCGRLVPPKPGAAERGSGEALRQTALAWYERPRAPARQPGSHRARLHLFAYSEPSRARYPRAAWAVLRMRLEVPGTRPRRGKESDCG